MELYRRRNIIERLFGMLYKMWRFACRVNKLDDSNRAFVQQAFMKVCPKPYFSDIPCVAAISTVSRSGHHSCLN